jgi:hypothetical protein
MVTTFSISDGETMESSGLATSETHRAPLSSSVDLRVFASQGDVLPFEVDILGVRPGIHNHYVPILCGVNG